MFTGIIEEIGTISAIQNNGPALKLTISAQHVLEDVKVGDSIAVDGACLTVTSFTDRQFTVDVIAGTNGRTKFSAVKPGYKVNLERALLATSRLGGHFVAGHIDTVSKVLRKTRMGNAIVLHIELDHKDRRLMIDKGSVAVDGTSLTVFNLHVHYFEIQLIPETQHQTKLETLMPGDRVHIEFDMLGKYILRSQSHNIMEML